jgi:hypothetical protein
MSACTSLSRLPLNLNAPRCCVTDQRTPASSCISSSVSPSMAPRSRVSCPVTSEASSDPSKEFPGAIDECWKRQNAHRHWPFIGRRMAVSAVFVGESECGNSWIADGVQTPGHIVVLCGYAIAPADTNP